MRATDRGLTTSPDLAAKDCKRCKEHLPTTSFRWVRGIGGRADHWYSYCKPCEAERLREMKRIEDPPVSDPGVKVCSRCRTEKPTSEFHFRRSYNRIHPVDKCKPCAREARREWAQRNKERNRARARTYYKKRTTAYVAMKGGAGDDFTRKLLASMPVALATEGEMAAYFHGFMAGIRRDGAESKSFERLKDLCHRIAAEVGQMRGIGYEDALSAAYEGLLVFLRRGKVWESDGHERRAAAQAIRCAITDYKRANGDVGRTGKVRNAQFTFSEIEQEDNPIAPGIASGADAQPWDLGEALGDLDLDPKDQEIMRLIAQGWKFKDVGEKLGITESRVGQRLKRLREKHGERLLAALS